MTGCGDFEAHSGNDGASALNVEEVRAGEDRLELGLAVDAIGNVGERFAVTNDVHERIGIRRSEKNREAENSTSRRHRLLPFRLRSHPSKHRRARSRLRRFRLFWSLPAHWDG